jgi:hypothetical protein
MLAFLFLLLLAPIEDEELYELFYTTFLKLSHIDLSICHVESDQGSALKAVCIKFQNVHFVCQRHFLVSLKQKPFSYQIGNLSKYITEKDFLTLKE